MMDRNHHLTTTCWICGKVEHGRFPSSRFYCDKHLSDEVDHHQCMPENPSKDDKRLSREYARRWKENS